MCQMLLPQFVQIQLFLPLLLGKPSEEYSEVTLIPCEEYFLYTSPMQPNWQVPLMTDRRSPNFERLRLKEDANPVVVVLVL